MKRNKIRLLYAAASAFLLLTEVLIALYVHDRFVRPYVGDMLVVIVIYAFVRILIPDGCKWLPLWIFLFAAGVEVLQYLRIVEVLGLQNNAFFRILIGSVFDWKDIICYAVGCSLVAVCSVVKNRGGKP